MEIKLKKKNLNLVLADILSTKVFTKEALVLAEIMNEMEKRDNDLSSITAYNEITKKLGIPKESYRKIFSILKKKGLIDRVNGKIYLTFTDNKKVKRIVVE